MKAALVQIVLLFVMTSGSLSQTSHQPDLNALEETVGKQFNELRAKADMRPLEFRRDIRIRMEACSVALNGPDRNVEFDSQYALRREKLWYLTGDPAKPNGDMANLAQVRTTNDHVAVGIWFGPTKGVSKDMFWVVVMPEPSGVHEAFWSHFCVTDDCEYQTVFDKYWKKRLPEICRTIK
jgi:hypothetical protein